MKKILFVQNSFAPYRMYLFNNLSQFYDIEVLYLENFDQNRKWNNLKDNIQYKYYICKNYELMLMGKKISIAKFNSFDFNSYDEVVIITNFPNIYDISRIALKLRNNYILWISIYKNYKVFESNSAVNFLLNKWVKILIKYSKKTIGYCQKSCEITKDEECIFSSQYYPLEIEYGKISHYDIEIYNKKRFKKEVINLVTISYLTPRKNIEFAIDIINTFPNIKLHIIGSGSENYEKYLKSISNENIIFYGYQVGNKKTEILRNSDYFLFTTKKDSWGFVINEALYFGLPVISSDKAMATLDLIQDDYNGFVYKNKEELIIILNRIVNENNFINYNQLSLNAKSTIDNFNDRVITNFKKLLG
jgi:glycosyltransferase involved in cell wall biosynthesis